MKPGDIIRRKCSIDGKPIGPYMRIMVIKDNIIYADTIGTDEPNILISKKNCYICKCKSLIVSEDILERLKSGKTNAVQHPVCKTWYNVFLNTPDLITFRTMIKNYKATFVVDNVRTTMSLGKPIVRIVTNYRIELIMYKTSKPGQLCCINGIMYRAKKRTSGCTGCALDSLYLCPNIIDKRKADKPLKCDIGDFILVREPVRL